MINIQSNPSQKMQMLDTNSGDRPAGALTQPRSSPAQKKTATHGSAMGSWSHLIAGATGGMATALLTSPLDVLRTRLQSDFYHTQQVAQASKHMNLSLPRTFVLHFRETFDTLIAIHRVEGWRSLFKGLGPSMTGVVPATAIKFYTYGNCKRLLPDVLSVDPDASIVHLLSATSAGIVTGTATNPIWLVKTRLQLDKSRVNAGRLQERQYKNSLDCVRQVVQQEGVRGLYRGLTASYLGVIETALHLTVYERLKNILTKSNQIPGQPQQTNSVAQGLALSSAAGLSKLFAVLIAYPHEVLRTRLRQAPMENGRQKYTGIVQCLRLMVKEEGVISLYGGLTAHLLRTVPSAIITLGSYELVLKLLEG